MCCRVIVDFIGDVATLKDRDPSAAEAHRVATVNEQVWYRYCVGVVVSRCQSWYGCVACFQTMIDYMRTKSVMGTSARDFVTLGQCRVQPDGSVVMLATSTTHPSCPQAAGGAVR